MFLSLRPLAVAAPLIAVGPFTPFASAQTAYLPEPGTTTLTPLYSYQRARDFYVLGDQKRSLPDPLEQHTTRIALERTIAPGWGMEASFGWSTVHYQESATLTPSLNLLKDGKQTRSGLTDTKVGLRRILLDEFASTSEFTPTLAVRLGGILQGTYGTGFVNAPGDGASGAELGLLAAKSFPLTGTTLFGDATWRTFAENVPDAVEISVGLSQQIQRAALTLGFRHQESLDGIDILGHGFASLASFPDVKEINTSVELGLSLPVGPVTIGLGFAQTISGENTPRKSVYAVSSSYGF
jgi:hypothetical protein